MTDDITIIPGGSLTTPRGFKAGAAKAGIRPDIQKLDVGLLYSECPCSTGAVYTTNTLQAAPIILTRENLANGKAQGVIANSGCANAATGEEGLNDAKAMARLAADMLGLDPKDIAVASTGVIGTFLPVEKIRQGIRSIQLSSQGGLAFAQAIMTTDTHPKQTGVRFGEYLLGGAAKGAGMIHPNMATMLCFLTTDAAVEEGFLKAVLKDAVDFSFNQIDIDSDTSTNDMVLLMANGLASGDVIDAKHPMADPFRLAVRRACLNLAMAIVSDAEGATKIIEAQVTGAASLVDARKAAREVVRSLAVKTAVYGCDPNWGRVLAAVGNSGCQMKESKVSLWLEREAGESICLYRGRPLPFDQQGAAAILQSRQVRFKIDLSLGNGEASAWGSDLTEDYVKLNSLYTT